MEELRRDAPVQRVFVFDIGHMLHFVSVSTEFCEVRLWNVAHVAVAVKTDTVPRNAALLPYSLRMTGDRVTRNRDLSCSFAPQARGYRC